MKIELLVPKVNTNDDHVKVSIWYFKDGDKIRKGDIIADLETSKANFEYEAEQDGILKVISRAGGKVAIGAIIGLLFSTVEEMRLYNDYSINENNIDASDIANEKIIEQHDTYRLSGDAKSYIKANDIDISKIEIKGLVSLKKLFLILNNTKGQISQQLQENTLRNELVTSSKLYEIEQLEIGQKGNLTSSLTVLMNTEGLFNNRDNTKIIDQRLPIILYELAALLKDNPKMCSFYTNKKIYYYDEVNIGIAMDLENQLKVPVIHKADELSIEEIEKKVVYFIDRYFENKFSLKDITTSTFTVTDLSGENIFSFQPLINGQQSAILGIGMDADLTGKPMTLTMTFDHRVHSGAEIANFLNQLKFRTSKYKGVIERTDDNEIKCSKCLTDIKSLKELYQYEAFMLKCINENGKQDYICHICSKGY